MYVGVKSVTQGASPTCACNHSINLQPGTIPINVRPYFYAYHHKDEIEKQVRELLDNGVIHHSISPFSGPVILVKKKDYSWRMCVDFRVLSKITILDKYPIPTIGELNDEFHGSHYFFKLDLKSRFHQIRIVESDIPKDVFRTYEGYYKRRPSFICSIINDHDPLLLSKFWGELFRLQGTKLRMSTTYHPQTDSQTEVVNRCLETYLRCFTSEQPSKWHLWLSCTLHLIRPQLKHPLRFFMGDPHHPSCVSFPARCKWTLSLLFYLTAMNLFTS